MNSKIAILAALVATTLASESAQADELIVNGGFEASSSNFTTPPGWTNVGHEDGVLQYATTAPNITPKTISNKPNIPAVPASISFIPRTSDQEAMTEAIAKISR